MRPLLTLETFAKYRRLRETCSSERSYTEPFVPCLGNSYGAMPKVMFSGVAIWEPKLAHYNCSDEDAWQRSGDFTRQFLTSVGTRASTSAFWRAFDVITDMLTGGQYELCQRADACIWTNISKLGEEGRLAPRDSGRALRRLDAEQLRREIEETKPDWLVCLSGNARQSTGYDVWGTYQSIDLPSRRTAATEIRRLPNGGVLFWSMHPNYKPADWLAGVVEDLRDLKRNLDGASQCG